MDLVWGSILTSTIGLLTLDFGTLSKSSQDDDRG